MNVHAGENIPDTRLPGFLPMCGRLLHPLIQFLRSMEIVFGFRVAGATMTIGVVAVLETTQVFFI